MSPVKRWTIHTSYGAVDPEGIPYRVGPAVHGPEQRESIEVFPAEEVFALVEAGRAAVLAVLSGNPERKDFNPLVAALEPFREEATK